MFGYCIVVSLTAFSVICNKTFYKVYTLLSHTPHHTKSPLSSRGRDIFSVKEWRDLENQLRGRLGSLKMALFDRPYATFYWSAIVNIALSCTIFELFDVG